MVTLVRQCSRQGPSNKKFFEGFIFGWFALNVVEFSYILAFYNSNAFILGGLTHTPLNTTMAAGTTVASIQASAPLAIQKAICLATLKAAAAAAADEHQLWINEFCDLIILLLLIFAIC